MCRLAAYTGSPVLLESLLYEAPHSLEVQAYRPREMLSGHVNVDGTGVVWWSSGERAPLRYVSAQPPWSDANLPGLAGRLSGAPVVAVVRSQTPGMPAGVAAVHPFTYEGWAGAHNGYLREFAGYAHELIGRIDDHLVGALEVVSDARVLFLLAVGALRRGASLTEALVETAGTAAQVCAAHDVVASLNLVLADQQRVAVLRAARGETANSLYVASGAQRWPGGCVLASEALDDDPAWHAVPEDHVVTLEGTEVTIDPVSF
ncbi:MAG: class II glutamine amidotransferase [Acidobacteriota bacterium]|jgi:glutamine amidotransferase